MNNFPAMTEAQRQELTQQELKSLISYNPETGLFTWLKSAGRVKKCDIAGYLNQKGYVEIRINGSLYKAHRLAVLYMTGRWPEITDHKNRVKHDNRWSNLRICNKSENNRNRGMLSNNTSGFKGVTGPTPSGKWKAEIVVGNKKICLGHFSTAYEAGIVASEARKKHYGEYAS